MLQLQGVSHAYGGQDALRDIDLSMDADRVGLVGANGAGKSTLLSICSGALKPTEGDVVLDGLSMFGRKSRRGALVKVALMPQHLHIPGHLTAFEAVSYLTWMRGARWRDATRLAHVSLSDVGLGTRSSRKVKSLSGGMRRRVALAQALAASPELLLLDEPTTGLDPEQRRAVRELIADLPHRVLISSHVIEDVEQIASLVWVLDKGTMRFQGTANGLAALAPDPDGARAVEDGLMALMTREGSE